MKMYIERNNIHVELIRLRRKIATLLPAETLKLENFCDRRVYEIGLIAIRDVSPPFGAEPWTCARKALGRGSRAFFYLLFQLTKNADRYGISTVNRYRSIPGAGSLKLC